MTGTERSDWRNRPDGSRAPVATVVALDDEEAILAAIRSLLRREQYALHTFADAGSALDFLRHNPAEIIASDLRMPGMGGIDFLRSAAQLRPTSTRIMLSGYEDRAAVIEALADGVAHHYVLKPWEDVALRNLIRHALSLHQRLKEDRAEAVLRSLDGVPAASHSHQHLQELLENPASAIADIVEEVESSPALVAKVLQVANSVFSTARNPISTVREAVMFIGTEYVTSLIIAVETFHALLVRSSPQVLQIVDMLWHEAVRRAAILRSITSQTEGLQSHQTAHIVTILQDIGLVLQACQAPVAFAAMLAECQTQQLSRSEAFLGAFGTAHEDMGGLLLQGWNMPQEIVWGVERHHSRGEHDAVMLLVQAADLLEGSDPFMIHHPGTEALARKWSERLGLPPR